jgi:D-xylose transport system substrate-binding protein
MATDRSIRRFRLALVPVLLLALAACGGGAGGGEATADGEAAGGGEAAGADEDITVGVSFRTQRQGRWAFETAMMEEEAERLGVELLVQDANEDPAQQAAQVENMISQGIDALILGAVDAGAALSIVDRAEAAGIPVVAYDTPVDHPDLDFFVTRNNVDVGVMQAEAALEWADEGATWAIFKGDPSAGVAREIAEGYEQTLAEPTENGEVEVVLDQFHDGWDSQLALENAENVLTANPDVKVFLSSSDGLAAGVSRALAAQGLEGEVFVSGLDGEPANLKLIADGAQTMTVWAPLDEWATTALQAAVALAEGEEPEADGTTEVTDGEIPTAFVELLAVNQDNLCEFVTEIAPEGWADKDEVFAGDPDACE